MLVDILLVILYITSVVCIGVALALEKHVTPVIAVGIGLLCFNTFVLLYRCNSYTTKTPDEEAV